MATEGGRAKLKQTKEWLFEWSDGQLNDQYWQDLQAGLVDENYWEQHS